MLFAFMDLSRQQIRHTFQSILFYPLEMEIIGTAPMCWNTEVYPLGQWNYRGSNSKPFGCKPNALSIEL